MKLSMQCQASDKCRSSCQFKVRGEKNVLTRHSWPCSAEPVSVVVSCVLHPRQNIFQCRFWTPLLERVFLRVISTRMNSVFHTAADRSLHCLWRMAGVHIEATVCRDRWIHMLFPEPGFTPLQSFSIYAYGREKAEQDCLESTAIQPEVPAVIKMRFGAILWTFLALHQKFFFSTLYLSLTVFLFLFIFKSFFCT